MSYLEEVKKKNLSVTYISDTKDSNGSDSIITSSQINLAKPAVDLLDGFSPMIPE